VAALKLGFRITPQSLGNIGTRLSSRDLFSIPALFAFGALINYSRVPCVVVQFPISSMSPSVANLAPAQNGFKQSQSESESKPVSPAPPPTLSNYTSHKLINIPNPSLQVTAQRTIKVVPSPIEPPACDEVLIHIKVTGICGSDVHFWRSGCIGSLKVEGDCILGHEASGIILQVGSGVSNFQTGDRVAIEPGVPCEACFLCREGKYNLCDYVAFSGVYPYDGTVQRLKCHKAKWVHKLPDNLTYAQGALLEPLSVVLHAISSCGLSIGRPATIHGAGPIGLIALAAARASGAHPLVITDVEKARLAFAKRFVPSCETYLVRSDLDAQRNAENIRALFSVRRRNASGVSENECSAPSTVLECTGIESSIATAAYTARRGGTVMVIGVGKAVINNLPFMHLSLAEVGPPSSGEDSRILIFFGSDPVEVHQSIS
jgi:L-iditol 2-dehydrogenase